MKKDQIFMLMFSFTPNFDHEPTEEEKAQMQEQWGGFIGNLAITEKLVGTYQLGFEGRQIQTDGTVTDGILYSHDKTLSGNMVVKANSLDEATELAKACPILKMGGSVEVRSIIPM